MRPFPPRLIPAALALLVCGCSSQPMAQNGGYKVVRESYDYGIPDQRNSIQDQRSQQWNSQSAALESCHQSGFTNAEPAAPPQTSCMSRSADSCTRWHATITYDCVGMGWQDN
jgi:hypothetical protein